MKKIICIILCMLLAVCFAGCGNNDQDSVLVDPNDNQSASQNDASSKTSAEVEEQDDILFFESDGIKIRPYDLAEDVLADLGEANGTFEAPSCAYQGTDFFYYYDGFELTVNDVDDADHVTVINVVDDTISIPQGVKVGSTEGEMLECMGDDYSVESGLYQFTEGNTTLQIQIKEGNVAAIMYIYTPD